MAYTDDAVLAKLSALNETQESIVTVAQWVMFHRRHADRTGQLWLQRLKDSGSNKRLNLIYLANEVVQQSKARKKDDFLIAFSPVIAEATAAAYKGATHEVQQKLRRVVEVWRSRNIFETPIQEAIESRIDELDKNKATTKPGFGGHGLFSKSSGPSVPADLVQLVAPQQTITKLFSTTATQITTANAEYEKQTDPNVAPPSAPVHAARLNGLLRSLASAESAVAESIKARTLLISGLEKLLDANRAALAKEQEQHAHLSARKSEIDAKKREVEDAIMKGFATTSSNPATPRDASATPGTPRKEGSQSVEADRPEVEALTPPPFERLSATPPQQQPSHGQESYEDGNNNNKENEQQPMSTGNSVSGINAQPQSAPPAHDLLATLTGAASAYGMATNGASEGSATKKRKLGGGFNDEIDLGSQMDGIDDDVQAMLDGGM